MTAGLAGLIKLDKSHVDAAARMLVRAFKDYPLGSIYFPEESTREKYMLLFFQVPLYYCVKHGEVYVTSPAMEGVAAWMPSERFPMAMGKMMGAVPLSVMLNFGKGPGSKLRSFGDYIDNVHRRLVPGKHWFLQVIGVDPPHQGKGYASRLLRPMLERIKVEGLPCYLETIDPTDVPIYQHFGFKVIDQSKIPGTEITNWAMLKEVK